MKRIVMLLLVMMSSMMHAHKKVVVIGAGLAGLTTAYRLHQQGVDVAVYEAHNRVGGRVFTVKVDGHLAELGAQNILDGGEAEYTLQLVKECGLQLESSVQSFNRNYFDGQKFVSVDDIVKNFHYNPEELQHLLTGLAQRSTSMQDVFNALFDQNDYAYSTGTVQITAYEGGTPDQLSTHYIKTLFHMMLGGLSVAHPHKDNTFAQITVAGGNTMLPQALAKSLGDCVHLNMPLVAIEKRGSKYILTFADNQQVVADILVLTIPCSVYSDIQFNSLIPQERRAAISAIGFGTNAKIVVPFTKTVPQRKSYMFNEGVAFFNRDLNVMNLYLVGKNGAFDTTNLQTRYGIGFNILAKAFGESMLPEGPAQLARDEQLSAYLGAVGHSWANDPYAKGSYSFVAAGQEEVMFATQDYKGEQVKSAFAPIDDSLFFAGEHTTINMDVLGTMEAACESGERMARMVAKTLN